MLQGMFNGTIKYFTENEEQLNDRTKMEKAFNVFWDAIKR